MCVCVSVCDRQSDCVSVCQPVKQARTPRSAHDQPDHSNGLCTARIKDFTRVITRKPRTPTSNETLLADTLKTKARTYAVSAELQYANTLPSRSRQRQRNQPKRRGGFINSTVKKKLKRKRQATCGLAHTFPEKLIATRNSKTSYRRAKHVLSGPSAARHAFHVLLWKHVAC